MKAFLALFSVILTSALSWAQPMDTLWTSPRGRIIANDICVLGNTVFFGGDNDGAICVEAWGTNGVPDWSTTWGVGTGSTISDMETANSGALYVVGTIEHDSEPDEMLLSRFNFNGIVGQYDLSAWGAFRGDQIKRNSDGEMFVTGKGVTDTIRSILFKLSATGDVLWSYSSTDAFSFFWGDIAPAADGGCFLCDGLNGVRLRKISAEGQLEWDSTYADLPLPLYVVRSTALDAGDVVMAYINYDQPHVNTFAKFSATGELLLSHSLQFPDTAFAISQLSLSALGNQIVNVTRGYGMAPLTVLNSDLDTLWTYSPIDHGLYWGDVTSAAFVTPENLAFAMFDYEDGGHFGYLGSIMSAPDAFPELPRVIFLGAYPNPFNSVATLTLQLSTPSSVKVSLLDILGRQVVEFSDGRVTAGEHHYIFNAADLSSGVYFAQLQAGEITRTVKLVLMK